MSLRILQRKLKDSTSGKIVKTETEMLTLFMNGLYSDLKRSVTVMKPKTLEEARAVAISAAGGLGWKR